MFDSYFKERVTGIILHDKISSYLLSLIISLGTVGRLLAGIG
jgi:hypothetical protein